MSFSADTLLVYPFLLIFIVSGILTIISRGVQFRIFPILGKIITDAYSKTVTSEKELPPLSSLAMALSTTIGIGNMVGPGIAMSYGGPGALAGFIIGTLLGGATIFTEAWLAVAHRRVRKDNSIAGGPMEYLKNELSFVWAWTYAFFGIFLLASWSCSQSNSLATILSQYSISPVASGVLTAILLFFTMHYGISFIGKISKILVPIMFILYSSSILWIILQNAHKIPAMISLVIDTFISPKTVLGGAAGVSFAQVIRWGFARPVQIDEIGTGTTAFPHAVSTSKPYIQATLATLALYVNGFLCLISGLCVLLTHELNAQGSTFDIGFMSHVFETYFGKVGHLIIALCAFMFAFGTIVGNCYNGSQCFLFITKNRWLKSYYFVTCCSIIFGAIADVSVVWGIIDYFVIPVAVPHILGILYIAYKRPSIFDLTTETKVTP